MKKHKITEEQIKEISNGKDIRDIFPEVFEEKLEVGEWYIYENTSTLVFYQGKGIATYGFYNPTEDKDDVYFEFHADWFFDMHSKWTLATKEEVEQALINEAVKRGFKDGVKIKTIRRKDTFNLTDKKPKYYSDDNTLYFGGWLVFENGVWAEIIEQPKVKITIEEIEQKLGYEIEIVNNK